MRKAVLLSALALALLLSACGLGEGPTPTPTPQRDYTQLVAVTGEVVPGEQTQLSPQIGGRVVEVLVERGEEVSEGDALARIDAAEAEIAVQQAEAALASAQAELARLESKPRSEEVASAEARLDSAQANVVQADAERDRLMSGALETEIASAEAQLAQARYEEKAARDAYDQLQDAGMHGWKEEEAILRLRAAEEATQAAQAALEQARQSADDRERSADAAVWAAAAQRDVAQAQLELLKAGATDAELDAARAAVDQAEASLRQAELQLERCVVRAPFDGTVGLVQVDAGEMVSPGQPIFVLGDLSTLRIETTDLDEVDVTRISLDQEAQITFEALPGETFSGRITRIPPMAEPGGGGVNYTVVIELDGVDPRLRWGMTAFVDIEVEE